MYSDKAIPKTHKSDRGHEGSRGFSFVLVIVVVLLVIGALLFLVHNIDTETSQTSTSTSASSMTIPQAKRYWIMGTSALNDVAVNPDALKALSHDVIFVSGKKEEQLVQQVGGLHIVPVESFTSEAQLASAITNKSIDPSIKALLYDNEDWSLTPANEQNDLLGYYKKAASLAHAHGYIFIGTPVSKTDPQAPVQIAPYVDVLDIQSQFDQAVASKYSGHVLPLAQDARKANAKLIILSGLSTNPSAGVPTPQQLVDDSRSVNSIVQGYWLNIPSPGTACPKCNSPHPEVGIEFLSMLGITD